MATMVPCSPITCGIATSGGLKPERAQAGSGPKISAAEQASSAVGAALAVDCGLALLADDSAGLDARSDEHPAAASNIASKTSA